MSRGVVERWKAWLNRVRNDGPVRFLLLFILAQTLAVALAAEALTRGLDAEWKKFAVLAPAALVCALAAFGCWAMRGDARKRGTAITLVVPREPQTWQKTTAIETAKKCARRHNYLYYYPLVSPAVNIPPHGRAHWSKAIEFHGTVLKSIFARDWGFETDPGSRVQLSFAAPTSIAFEMGIRWDEFTDRNADTVEVVNVFAPTGDKPGTVLWCSDQGTRGIMADATEAAERPVGTVVLLLQRDFKHEPLVAQFGERGTGYIVIGEETTLVDNDPRVERSIAELMAILSARKHEGTISPSRRLQLIFATAVPVAFAAGWRLRAFRDVVEVLEFDRATMQYFSVDFGEGLAQ